MTLPEFERDAWWTLLLFFNSLRELGTSVSMLQSDVPTYLKAIRNRKGITPQETRSLNFVRELTSRLRNDEVPKALDELSRSYGDKAIPVDVCLASNIIEVGVDVDRLGLMAVVGQPKSTSQYIQVTGRVGRQAPGLVVTLYAVAKPRDRSHFEKFRSYHERLYAQVEPTSVTPFSTAVLERALHAILVGYVRQKGNRHSLRRPSPFPARLLEEIADLLRERVDDVDPSQGQKLEELLKTRLREWKSWNPQDWTSYEYDRIPLLRQAGSYVPPHWRFLTWSTARSMRNVDAECQTVITTMTAAEETANE
jgi:superfamily II DNA/RNA helicase